MAYPQMRILRVRSCIADLEHHRHQRSLDRGVIGRISNKKRDLAGELAVIPKRVPFKWQRGNKIGEELILEDTVFIVTMAAILETSL